MQSETVNNYKLHYGKRIALMIIMCAVLIICPNISCASYIPPATVFVQQKQPWETYKSCTLASAVMVLRSYVYRSITRYGGDCPADRYLSIDEDLLMEQTVPCVIWGPGLSRDFTFRDRYFSIRMIREYPPQGEDIAAFIEAQLKKYPEGIVLYGKIDDNNQHAVFLYDYDSENDVFYCGEPYYGTDHVELKDCIFFRQFGSQEGSLSHVDSIWHVDHSNVVVACPPQGFASYSDTKDLSNNKTVNQYKGKVAYLGSYDNMISRVDLGSSDILDDKMGIILYDDSFEYDEKFTGKYIAFMGEGTYYLDQYTDGTGNSFDNKASAAIVFTSSDPPFSNIQYNTVEEAHNLIVNPAYAAEIEPTATPTVAATTATSSSTGTARVFSYDWYVKILKFNMSEAFDFLGSDYEYTGAAADGWLMGFSYDKLDITLGSYDYTYSDYYNLDYSSVLSIPIDFIQCSEGAQIGAVQVGMTLSEIETVLGQPNKVIEGDLDSPYIYYYNLPQIEISIAANTSLDTPTYTAFVELID